MASVTNKYYRTKLEGFVDFCMGCQYNPISISIFDLGAIRLSYLFPPLYAVDYGFNLNSNIRNMWTLQVWIEWCWCFRECSLCQSIQHRSSITAFARSSFYDGGSQVSSVLSGLFCICGLASGGHDFFVEMNILNLY